MTRANAVKIVGEKLVSEAEDTNCEYSYTNDGGYDVYIADSSNDDYRTKVIFLQDPEKVKDIPFDEMDWRIEEYEVEEI